MRRAAFLLPALLAGCNGIQAMTGGQGRDSQSFNTLFTVFNLVAALFFLLVVAGLAAAILRRRGSRQDGHSDEAVTAPRDGALSKLLIVWILLVAVGLAALTLLSWLGDRRAAAAALHPEVEIIVTGRQWWWQVDYGGAQPNEGFTTANELHLPVGVPTRIKLRSNDVIHSFWIPNLAGKQDLVPGRENEIVITPTATGRYRGQCAEYCGLQHAHMALDVVVDTRENFERWRQAQLQPARAPDNPLRLAGYNYVTTRECATCHNIGGTPASGRVGPDLTHVASRRTIGAGTYPMTRGHLYGWVADPQSAKPGNQMPVVGLSPAELHAVVAYLESLR